MKTSRWQFDPFVHSRQRGHEGVAERQAPKHQLECQYPQSPPVDRHVISRNAHENFRRHVPRGAQFSTRPLVGLQALGEPKVDKLEISIRNQHEVFWLQVSVHDTVGMEVLTHNGHVREIEHDLRLVPFPPKSVSICFAKLRRLQKLLVLLPEPHLTFLL